uniref:Uncharacterized protein n=1 Tax=Heterorhabditis bacteriophora TaxID=37862 RepID=A0A1I7WAE6_HETBA
MQIRRVRLANIHLLVVHIPPCTLNGPGPSDSMLDFLLWRNRISFIRRTLKLDNKDFLWLSILLLIEGIVRLSFWWYLIHEVLQQKRYFQ